MSTKKLPPWNRLSPLEKAALIDTAYRLLMGRSVTGELLQYLETAARAMRLSWTSEKELGRKFLSRTHWRS